ncbi:MAG: omega-amidase [Cellvibrionaceae bacterium]|jgi:omega-amidase
MELMKVATQLRVTLVQTALCWLDPVANRQQLEEKFLALKGKTDLVVLPEMFTSGFTVEPEIMHDANGTVAWLQAQAQFLGAAITGSVACDLTDQDIIGNETASKNISGNLVSNIGGDNKPRFVNRMLFVTPQGEMFNYDKVHLFKMADEHKRYQAGNERCVINYMGWRILLTVCYDLRFPVFCRNRNDYDMMLCVANWPKARAYHWRSLLIARAIENQAFVVGVNRVGTDGNGLEYSGDSLAIDYLGELLVDKPNEWVETLVFDLQALVDYRQRFRAWEDADDFALKI